MRGTEIQYLEKKKKNLEELPVAAKKREKEGEIKERMKFAIRPCQKRGGKEKVGKPRFLLDLSIFSFFLS